MIRKFFRLEDLPIQIALAQDGTADHMNLNEFKMYNRNHENSQNSLIFAIMKPYAAGVVVES